MHNKRKLVWKKQILAHDLLENQDLQLFFAQCILVLVEVEELLWNGIGNWLVVGVVIRFEIGVLECVFDCNAFDRVECKQFLKQVECQVGGLWEHCFEGNLLFEWKRADVLASTSRLDAVVVFHGWCAKDVQDEGQLVVIWQNG